MKIELVTIGDELLIGKIINTNISYIGDRLLQIGLRLNLQSTISDDSSVMHECLQKAVDRSDIVITTGGLGPTIDDNTKDVLAKIFHKQMRRDKKILAYLNKRYKKRVSKLVKTQADVPRATTIIPNRVGTAPGFIFQEKDKIAIALPGPPAELKPMFEKKVIPFLKKMTAGKEIFAAKTFRTIGIRESVIDTKLKKILTGINGLTYGLNARPYQVDVRLSCRANTINTAQKIIARGEKILFKHLAESIFTADDRPLEEVVGTLLRHKKITVALAESCTGGLISNRITDISGSSDYFLGTMVVYSNQWKNNFLGVPERILKKYGAVSPQTAKCMAANVRIKGRADLGLAVTGIAGPTGGTAQKPVGLVYIALADKNKTWCWRHHLRGDRSMIKTLTSQAALNHLREYLVKK